MKNTIFILITSFLTLPAFSADYLHCEGGIADKNRNYSVDLDNGSTPEYHSWATLSTEVGRVKYSIDEVNNHFEFKIINLLTSEIYLQENVESLPASKSISIKEDYSFFIKCITYTQKDYCRYHTC